MTHLCQFCGRELPIEEFPDRSKRSWKCRDCRADYMRKWREANPDKLQPLSYYRDYNQRVGRFQKYGMTRERFEEIWRDQFGCCAICQQPFVDASKVAIDHDHSCCPDRKRSCGRCVRGLLCSNCNTAIGLLQEDAVRLQEAVDYLERWGSP